MSDDIKEVVEIEAEFNKFIKKWCGNNYPHLIDTDENDGEFFREKLRILSDFAQRYLSAKRPEKVRVSQVPGINEGYWVSGINQALDDYRLFQLKEDDRKEAEFRKKLEGIHEVINKVFDDVEAPSQKVYTEDISTAIQTYLMDKERGK